MSGRRWPWFKFNPLDVTGDAELRALDDTAHWGALLYMICEIYNSTMQAQREEDAGYLTGRGGVAMSLDRIARSSPFSDKAAFVASVNALTEAGVLVNRDDGAYSWPPLLALLRERKAEADRKADSRRGYGQPKQPNRQAAQSADLSGSQPTNQPTETGAQTNGVALSGHCPSISTSYSLSSSGLVGGSGGKEGGDGGAATGDTGDETPSVALRLVGLDVRLADAGAIEKAGLSHAMLDAALAEMDAEARAGKLRARSGPAILASRLKRAVGLEKAESRADAMRHVSPEVAAAAARLDSLRKHRGIE